MTWIDYQHIKASVNISQVLAYYGIELRSTGNNQLAGPCPLPCHTGDRSNNNAFHVNTQKNAFNCFTHCGGGNVIDFVAKMENCEFREAALKLNEWFLSGGPADDKVEGSPESSSVEEFNKPLSFELKGLKGNHPFLRKTKNLQSETIKTFGLGFCSKGLLAGWVAIPIHNIDGQVVAYIGRAVNDTQAETDGKYKVPPGFKKSLEVFNLNRVLEQKDLIDKYGIIIVEGFFGVFWLYQNGFKNVVALMGKELSDRQREPLLSATDRFTIFLDSDEPGRLATEKLSGKLIHSAFVRIIEYPEGPRRKPAHFEKDELKELLSVKKPSLE